MASRYEVNGTMRDTNNQEANFIPGRGLVQVGQGIGGIHNVDYADFGPHLGFPGMFLAAAKSPCGAVTRSHLTWPISAPWPLPIHLRKRVPEYLLSRTWAFFSFRTRRK